MFDQAGANHKANWAGHSVVMKQTNKNEIKSRTSPGENINNNECEPKTNIQFKITGCENQYKGSYRSIELGPYVLDFVPEEDIALTLEFKSTIEMG